MRTTLSTPFQMELFTEVSGKISKGMGTGFRCGPIMLATKVIGKITKPMVRAYFTMLMGTFLKALGNLIRLMALGRIITQTAASIRASGSMTFKRVKVARLGSTKALIKECITGVKNTDRVCTLGPMAQCTRASG